MDPADGPCERFAFELRQLREEAGSPTYRTLAEKTHFSKATLSAAAQGRRLPTLDVALAYAQACGGDLETWRHRWEEARAALGGAPSTVEAATEPPRTSPRHNRARITLVSATIICALIGVVFVFLSGDDSSQRTSISPAAPATSDESPTARFVPTGALSQQPVVDGADPKRSTCAADPDVTTVDSVEVNTADETYLGSIELRYAPKCDVAWGRFSPTDGTVRLTGAIVTITAQRRNDAPNDTVYQAVFDGQAVFGNILPIRHGCVQVAVRIVTVLSGQAEATTRCLRGTQ
ncbi:helix-turn-helix domain-containing protein [Amycolatopsis sp. CA-126428]|uniref:helix-turn-helix domain-containing protein n=1 Tax=Amycolatopsis sp. CA-126428 TaxID=2073158 RepID=UPI001E4E3F4C|nr:helix-turn-helix domain-containing protein [Amycolatopsis sp. CA-126428]